MIYTILNLYIHILVFNLCFLVFCCLHCLPRIDARKVLFESHNADEFRRGDLTNRQTTWRQCIAMPYREPGTTWYDIPIADITMPHATQTTQRTVDIAMDSKVCAVCHSASVIGQWLTPDQYEDGEWPWLWRLLTGKWSTSEGQAGDARPERIGIDFSILLQFAKGSLWHRKSLDKVHIMRKDSSSRRVTVCLPGIMVTGVESVSIDKYASFDLQAGSADVGRCRQMSAGSSPSSARGWRHLNSDKFPK